MSASKPGFGTLFKYTTFEGLQDLKGVDSIVAVPHAIYKGIFFRMRRGFDPSKEEYYDEARMNMLTGTTHFFHEGKLVSPGIAIGMPTQHK